MLELLESNQIPFAHVAHHATKGAQPPRGAKCKHLVSWQNGSFMPKRTKQHGLGLTRLYPSTVELPDLLPGDLRLIIAFPNGGNRRERAAQRPVTWSIVTRRELYNSAHPPVILFSSIRFEWGSDKVRQAVSSTNCVTMTCGKTNYAVFIVPLWYPIGQILAKLFTWPFPKNTHADLS